LKKQICIVVNAHIEGLPVVGYNVEPLVVRTADFRLAWRLLREIHNRKLPCIQLHPDDPLPYEDSVWLGTVAEVESFSDGRGVWAIEGEIELAIERALHVNRRLGPIIVLTFGVDPGPRPGLAWLADGVLIGVAQLERVDDVANHIRAIATAIEHDRIEVKIGDGSITLRNRIANVCIARKMHIEFVDERRTSHGISRHHHHAAATKIAMMQGKRVVERQSVSPADGELRELQRRSRRMSEGKLTISSDLAKAVAVGRITMEEAIDRQYSL
jgi:hypothetical protein